MVDWEAEYQSGRLLSRTADGDDEMLVDTQDDPTARTFFTDDDDGADFLQAGPSTGTPIQQLTRHWMNERHSPDILPSQPELLGSVLDHIRQQSDAVQILRDRPEVLEKEEDHLRMMLVQTEIERVKFIVRSYVCTRLYKIEKYARLVVANPEVQTRLTVSERDHAARHAKITEALLHATVLQSLPESQSHLDDAPLVVPPMISEPDKSRPVFAHALEDCPQIRLPDGTALELKKGNISLTPYAVVEHLILRGQVELV